MDALLELAMKDTLANKLASFEGTLAVADKAEFKSIWQNQPPLIFTNKLEEARDAVQDLVQSGAEQSVKTTGSSDALRGLRKQFEAALHPLARAVYRCLKNAGNAEDAAKANVTPSDLHSARAVALAGLGETILDLAEPLTKSKVAGEPATGEQYGVNAQTYASVDDLWQRYSTAVGAPAGARAKRKGLTAALPGKFAAAEEQFAELDDLVIQFRNGVVGNQFVEAWLNARHIADLGRRAAAKPASAPATTSPIQ